MTCNNFLVPIASNLNNFVELCCLSVKLMKEIPYLALNLHNWRNVFFTKRQLQYPLVLVNTYRDLYYYFIFVCSVFFKRVFFLTMLTIGGGTSPRIVQPMKCILPHKKKLFLKFNCRILWSWGTLLLRESFIFSAFFVLSLTIFFIKYFYIFHITMLATIHEAPLFT